MINNKTRGNYSDAEDFVNRVCTPFFKSKAYFYVREAYSSSEWKNTHHGSFGLKVNRYINRHPEIGISVVAKIEGITAYTFRKDHNNTYEYSIK
jgi:hypothetical protein